MTSAPAAGKRDPRVDLLRGFALLSIFIDHIPNNKLADYTLHNFGFSDAAELFVFLAGYSATSAYSGIFERDGLRVGLSKVYARCAKIYGVQVVLLLLTLATVSQWERFNGTQSVIVGAMLRDGLKGAIRGVTLEALPTYLDILPLYIVLLGIFPVIRYGLVRSVAGTIGVSVIIHAAANVFHWDLPSFVDPATATMWYFNPFTWQLVFVCGAAFAVGSRHRVRLFVAPPQALTIVCWAYLAFAFWALDPWKLWQQPFGADFPSTQWPFALLGNEPKSFVTPWRLLHVLAVIYLALTSPRLAALAHRRLLAPILACGRQSLYVFAVGCMLALFGRLIFKTAGVTPITEILVNVVGLTTMLACGMVLDRDRLRQQAPNDKRRLTPGRPETTRAS